MFGKLITIGILALAMMQVNGLHFYLQEGKEKCLMDDIPQGTQVFGYWHFMEPLPNVDQNSEKDGINIRIIGPDGKQTQETILTTYNKQKDHRGKFALAAPTSGSYKFCMKTTTRNWVSENKRVKYGLKLVIGEAEEVTDVAKDHHVSGLHQKIRDIHRTAVEFTRFQEMQRTQEDQLSSENLKVNDRVVLATILQTIVILCSGIFQIYSLRKFFIQKRLY